jgi:uncharacterized protein YrrD
MFLLGSKLAGLQVVALANGDRMAEVIKPVIDPSSLELVALICSTNHKQQKTLGCRDIREASAQLLLINSDDDLAEIGEVVRLEPMLKKPYQLTGSLVRTEGGTKLGKVADYAVGTQGWMVQKLYVRRPLLKSVLGSNLVIDRAQITDVSPSVITVREATIAEPVTAAATAAHK